MRPEGTVAVVEVAAGETHATVDERFVSFAVRDAYVLDAPERQGRTLFLNGAELVAPTDGQIGALAGDRLDATAAEHPPWIVLPPTSVAVAVFPEAEAPACR